MSVHLDYSIKIRYKCKLNIQLRVFIKLTHLQNSFTQFDGCGISTVVVNDLEFIKHLQIETLSVLVLEFRGIFLSIMRFSSGVLERKNPIINRILTTMYGQSGF